MDIDAEILRLIVDLDAPVNERNERVAALCERCYAETGRMPSSAQLQTLTNYIVAHELRDNRKWARDVPIYTDEQMTKKGRRFGVPISWEHDVTDTDVKVEMNVDIARYEEASSRQKCASRAQKMNEGKRKARTERRQRVHQVIDENPDATREEIARIAGVSPRTVYRYLNGR